jgi:ribose-phosphate pyrophosphokinase
MSKAKESRGYDSMIPSLELFAPGGTAEYAARVGRELGLRLASVEERDFEDGEHKIRPGIAVEGVDAYVIHALHGDSRQSVNDKLCRLLFLLGTLKDHGAARVTAVLPYLCYARKDRRTQPQDPVTSRYVAALFEAVGTDRVMAVQVHNEAAFDNSFRVPARHLETTELFADHFAMLAQRQPIVAVSPDAGGTKRVERFRRALEQKTGRPVGNGFVEKYRSGGVVTGGALIGEVRNRTAIILDDLIATGGTMIRAASACRAAGASRVVAAATHGLFSESAKPLFASGLFDEIVVTDSVPFVADDKSTLQGLVILPTASLIAAAIGQAHAGA